MSNAAPPRVEELERASTMEEMSSVVQTTDSSNTRTYYVRQGDSQFAVQPLSHENYGGRSVSEFYEFVTDESNSDQVPDELIAGGSSQLFFYEGPDEASLCIIHAAAEDDGSTSSQQSVVIDDFERSQLAHYTGFTGEATIVEDDGAISNSRLCRHHTHGNGKYPVASLEGLDAYPEPGMTFEYHFYVNDGGNVIVCGFASQGGEFSHRNRRCPDAGGYAVEVRNGQSLQFRKDERIKREEGIDDLPNGWHRLEVDWGTDGSIRSTLYDPADTAIQTVTYSDTTYESGGIHFGQDNHHGYANTTYFDAFTITGSSGQATTIDDFEDGDLSEYDYTDYGTSLRTDRTYEGTYALELPMRNRSTADGQCVSVSGDVPYPSRGDSFGGYLYQPDWSNQFRYVFAAQSASKDPDGYNVAISGQRDFLIEVDRGGTELARTSLSDVDHTGKWLEIVIDWDYDAATDTTTITATLYDKGPDGTEDNGQLVQIQGSESPSTYESGGLAFNADSNGSSMAFDNARYFDRSASGGTATFDFDWLPSDGSWVVQDEDSAFDGPTDTTPTWEIGDGDIAGGAYKGGFADAFLSVVEPSLPDEIDSWAFVDGNSGDPIRHSIRPTEPIAVGSFAKNLGTLDETWSSDSLSTSTTAEADTSSGLSSADSGDDQEEIVISPTGEVCFTTDPLGAGFCIDPFSAAPTARRPLPAAGISILSLGPRECSNRAGLTPPLVSVDISYYKFDHNEEVKAALDLWIGVELRGRPHIWIGEHTSGACQRLDSLSDFARDLATLKADNLKEVIDAAAGASESAIEAIEDLVGIDFPEWSEPFIIPVVAIVLIILVLAAIFTPIDEILAVGGTVVGGLLRAAPAAV